jgi:hypothetical protein
MTCEVTRCRLSDDEYEEGLCILAEGNWLKLMWDAIKTGCHIQTKRIITANACLLCLQKLLVEHRTSGEYGNNYNLYIIAATIPKLAHTLAVESIDGLHYRPIHKWGLYQNHPSEIYRLIETSFTVDTMPLNLDNLDPTHALPYMVNQYLYQNPDLINILQTYPHNALLQTSAPISHT